MIATTLMASLSSSNPVAFIKDNQFLRLCKVNQKDIDLFLSIIYDISNVKENKS